MEISYGNEIATKNPRIIQKYNARVCGVSFLNEHKKDQFNILVEKFPQLTY